MLAWRVALGHLRHPGNFAARAVLTVLCGLLCWAVFGAQAPQDLAEVETDPDAALRHATYRGAAFTIPLFVTLICFVPLGCLMYEMVTGDPPFRSKSKKKLFQMIKTKRVNSVRNGIV